MWSKARLLAARSLAHKHLKPAFANLRIVSDNAQTNTPEVSESSPAEITATDPADLSAECDRLRAEVADLQDRLLRRQAEFENFRRRSERDRSDFFEYAGMEFVRELLPILDDFERARKTECSDESYRKGVELIYQRLQESLKKIGLEPVEVAAGTEFDPNLHQAVVRLETEEAPDHTILEEFQRGYNFKGKLLRPAMVKVAVKPA
jgi:molecular chaperone GrpE